MNNNRDLDETIKLFLLGDRDLRIKAELQGVKLLKEQKYNEYDKEFKNNFLKSFVQTFVAEIEKNRENLAYTLLQCKYPKDVIQKASRLPLKKIEEMDLNENKADILMRYLENRN